MAYTASLVHSLAWPVVVGVVIVAMRKPITAALGRGVHRLRVGRVEIEFDREAAEVRADLSSDPKLTMLPTASPQSDSGEETEADTLIEELGSLALVAPEAAVNAAWERIERRLIKMLDSAGAPTYSAVGGLALARLARRHELISEESLNAIAGLSTMRNLVVHRQDDIDGQRAREYLALADGVLYALSPKPAQRAR
jgi:hypothetical protein